MNRTHDLVVPLWFGGIFFLLYLAVLPVDVWAQLWGAGVISVGLLALRSSGREIARLLFLFLAAFLTLRYFCWRTLSTLSYNDLGSFLAAGALYGAETYGILIFLLGIFVNLRPLQREPIALSAKPQQFPTVDILIPTYNEPLDILETTLLAARHIRYPQNKFHVYLLDDGGTDQKCADPDPAKATLAHTRRARLQALCADLSVHYLTRETNDHAKAGNLNAALQRTEGEFVLILDADHVPTVDILEKTMGWFERDPKLFLVQTPHFFISPTPIEKNLETFELMPADSAMFYRAIQPGLDFWGASFFCGAAGVLRRTSLNEVGGIRGSTVTEDAETALALHSKGYHSAYIDHPMIAGLSPETFSGFITQRTRWAQGMVQLLLLKNPLRMQGLNIWQRLAYFNSIIFWLFGYARIIFLLAPSLYLLFGLQIYDADTVEILSYTAPHLLSIMLVTNYLFGHVRWPFISELYELMQSFFTVRGLSAVFRNPRTPTFLVTPKGEEVAEDFISPLSSPFYWLMAIIMVSLAAGAYRYLTRPAERYMIMITLAWELGNFILTLAALGALLEKRQRRRSPRTPVDVPAEIIVAHHGIPCHINDASIGGANLTVRVSLADAHLVRQATTGMLRVYNTPLEKHSEFQLTIHHQRVTPEAVVLGAGFTHLTRQEQAEKVAFVYGDSNRWVKFSRKREGQIGMLRGTLFLVKLGLTYSGDHLWELWWTTRRSLVAALGSAVRRVFCPGRAHEQVWRIWREQS